MSGDQIASGAGSADGHAQDDCEHVLEQVYAFLDHELDPASAATIRHHLEACEPCVDTYDLEVMVKSVIRRSCGGELAPAELRSRIIVSMTALRREP